MEFKITAPIKGGNVRATKAKMEKVCQAGKIDLIEFEASDKNNLTARVSSNLRTLEIAGKVSDQFGFGERASVSTA